VNVVDAFVAATLVRGATSERFGNYLEPRTIALMRAICEIDIGMRLRVSIVSEPVFIGASRRSVV
jgi:hypothetical protein